VHSSNVNLRLHSVPRARSDSAKGLARSVRHTARSHDPSFAALAALVAYPLLLATAPGCIAVDAPPSYADREKLHVEQVEATKGVVGRLTRPPSPSPWNEAADLAIIADAVRVLHAGHGGRRRSQSCRWLATACVVHGAVAMIVRRALPLALLGGLSVGGLQ
jgi:hypothetical protein